MVQGLSPTFFLCVEQPEARTSWTSQNLRCAGAGLYPEEHHLPRSLAGRRCCREVRERHRWRLALAEQGSTVMEDAMLPSRVLC